MKKSPQDKLKKRRHEYTRRNAAGESVNRQINKCRTENRKMEEKNDRD